MVEKKVPGKAPLMDPVATAIATLIRTIPTVIRANTLLREGMAIYHPPQGKTLSLLMMTMTALTVSNTVESLYWGDSRLSLG